VIFGPKSTISIRDAWHFTSGNRYIFRLIPFVNWPDPLRNPLPLTSVPIPGEEFATISGPVADHSHHDYVHPIRATSSWTILPSVDF